MRGCNVKILCSNLGSEPVISMPLLMKHAMCGHPYFNSVATFSAAVTTRLCRSLRKFLRPAGIHVNFQ